MPAVLYAIPASHPCAVVERALQLKGVPYRRVELIPVLHTAAAASCASAARPCPAVRVRGRHAQARLAGDRAGARGARARPAAAARRPRELRAHVERAEEWGDQVLQPLARRVVWAAIRRVPQARGRATPRARGCRCHARSRASARRSSPAWRGPPTAPTTPTVRADLLALPGHLDRIDAWIADGTLGGADVTRGDLQIAARACGCCHDRGRRGRCSRPARPRALARRAFPDVPGRRAGRRAARAPGCRLSGGLAPVRPHGERHGGGAREALAVAGGDVNSVIRIRRAPPHAARSPRSSGSARVARAPGRRTIAGLARAPPAPPWRRSAPTSVTTPAQRPTVASAQAIRTGTRPRRSSRALPVSTTRPANGFAPGGRGPGGGGRAGRRDGQREVVEVRVVVGAAGRAAARLERHRDRARERRHVGRCRERASSGGGVRRARPRSGEASRAAPSGWPAGPRNAARSAPLSASAR